MRQRPRIVAFDVVETIFSLEPLGSRLQQLGLTADLVGEWYTRLIRDAFALDATGVNRPFREVARAALRMLAAEQNLKPTDAELDSVMAGFAELPAFPDVAPAFHLLHEAKVPAICLTNGSADLTRQLLQRNQLDGLIERVISIDEIQHWKPNRQVYLHAAQVMKVAPEQLAMVAVHSWDIHGAGKAGLTTAWVSRREKWFNALMGPADFQADSLDGACRALLQLGQP